MENLNLSKINITTTVNKDDIYHVNSSADAKNICLIILNWDYSVVVHGNVQTNNQGRGSLPGFKSDAKILSDTFRKLGFKVIIQENKSVDEIRNIMSNIRKILNNKQNAFVCFFLCRGFGVSTTIDTEDGLMEVDGECGVVGVDGMGLLIVKELLEMFNNKNCEQFAHKPKLFFILSCRGRESHQNSIIKLS